MDRYQLAIKNYKTGKYDLMWESYTNKKNGYERVNEFNECQMRKNGESDLARLYDRKKKSFI